MKVFISGPMSSIKDYNKPAFDWAQKELEALGYSVFNPSWMTFDDSWTREDIMPIDIAALSRCDAIYMLLGWEKSKGATAEYNYAAATGKLIIKQSFES
mgnify:CR=1 FL=1